MSVFAVKLDESLGTSHLELIRSYGYEAEGTAAEGLNGESDDIVWATVCALGRLFVTLDLDFSDVRRFDPDTHPGILLVRPHIRSSPSISLTLRRVLTEVRLESFSGCLVVADPDKTRVRRPVPADSEDTLDKGQ